MNDSFKIDEHPIILLRPRISFPYAWVGHIPFAYLTMDLLRPKNFVELGTDSGNSYLAFCQAVEHLGLETKCVAIDSWQGDDHARRYGDEVFRALSAYHEPRYGRFSKLLRAFFQDAVGQFADGSIDLLHIDGLHTYEAVRNDFETWLPKLSDNAVVLLHDTEVRENDFGVWKFFQELSERYKVFDFRHSNGLGVVQVGANVPVAFSDFMDYAIAKPDIVRRYFESVATTIIDLDSAKPQVFGGDFVDHSIKAALYYRQANEIFEDRRSLEYPIYGGVGEYDLSFVLPVGVRPDFIRIDPANAPGIFVVRSVTFKHTGSEPLLVPDLQARAGVVNGDRLPRGNEMALAVLHDDPYFELYVTDLLNWLPRDGELVIDIKLTVENVIKDPLLWDLARTQGDAMGELRELARQHMELRSLGMEMAHLRALQVEALVRLQECEQRVTAGAAKLANDDEERRAALTAQEARLEHQLSAQTEVFGRLQEQWAQSHAAQNNLLEGIVLRLTEVTQQLSQQSSAMGRLESVHKSTLEDLSLIKSSRLWRWSTRVGLTGYRKH